MKNKLRSECGSSNDMVYSPAHDALCGSSDTACQSPHGIRGMTQKQAEILLAAVIIARSTSYLLSKLGMESMGPFTLLSLRFITAFLLLLLLFGKKLLAVKPGTLLRGMLLGGTFFAVMTAELFGLRSTGSSTTSFLENTAIVLVPLMEAMLHRRFPRFPALLSAAVTLFGIGLLTLRGGVFTIHSGELLCLLAAALYASGIILTDRVSRQDDPLTLGILQVGFIGLFALAASFLFEAPRLPANGTEWMAILALAIICSGFGFTLQPVAQSRTTSERAGMFCALNPVTAAVLGRLCLRERLGAQGILGAVFVLSGILLSTVYGRTTCVKTTAPVRTESTAKAAATVGTESLAKAAATVGTESLTETAGS